jgi:hypothetical protein
MHGIPIGDKLKYACGRYYNSGYTECSHNTVEAAAVTTMLIDALVELVEKAGGRKAIRKRLLAKARAEAEKSTAPEEPAALVHLRVTPSPNPDPGLVRESSCPWWGWKGFSDEEATQYRADRGPASAG